MSSLQRRDVHFVGIRSNYSELCVLHDIQRRNGLVSGRAWNRDTGISTPFLDINYNLKYRHLMKVYFAPDGTACGFEDVNYPQWKVCEGRIDSEMENVKMIGVIDMRYIQEDGQGKILFSPVGPIRINPTLYAEAESHTLKKVKISFVPRPENSHGKHIFWKVIGFVDGDRFGRPQIIFPAAPMARDPLLQQVGRMNHLLQFGYARIAHIKNNARYMASTWYQKVETFLENCEDIITEISFVACRDEAKELVMDSIETQTLGVEIFEYLLRNCIETVDYHEIDRYEAYMRMRKQNAAEWERFVR